MNTECEKANISGLGMRKVGLFAEANIPRDMGKALLISTKRGTELAWRFNNENLSEKKQKELFGDIYNLCKKSFRVQKGAEFSEDVKNHIYDAHEFCVIPFGDVPSGLAPSCFGTNRIAAFASYSFLNYWKNKEFIYFSGIVVDPSLHGLGYGSLLIKEIMETYGIKLAVLRTQSPVMYCSFAKVCDVHPSFLGKKTSGEIKNIAGYVATNILKMSEYDAKEMIEKGTYGESLYGEEPIINNAGLDRLFKQKININRGDSIIVVGTIKE